MHGMSELPDRNMSFEKDYASRSCLFIGEFINTFMKIDCKIPSEIKGNETSSVNNLHRQKSDFIQLVLGGYEIPV
jgi:hypothetical protein